MLPRRLCRRVSRRSWPAQPHAGPAKPPTGQASTWVLWPVASGEGGRASGAATVIACDCPVTGGRVAPPGAGRCGGDLLSRLAIAGRARGGPQAAGTIRQLSAQSLLAWARPRSTGRRSLGTPRAASRGSVAPRAACASCYGASGVRAGRGGRVDSSSDACTRRDAQESQCCSDPPEPQWGHRHPHQAAGGTAPSSRGIGR
jgi:hypothetical protein